MYLCHRSQETLCTRVLFFTVHECPNGKHFPVHGYNTDTLYDNQENRCLMELGGRVPSLKNKPIFLITPNQNITPKEWLKLWEQASPSLMAVGIGLARSPRKFSRKCSCFDKCNGNVRIHAFQNSNCKLISIPFIPHKQGLHLKYQCSYSRK